VQNKCRFLSVAGAVAGITGGQSPFGTHSLARHFTSSLLPIVGPSKYTNAAQNMRLCERRRLSAQKTSNPSNGGLDVTLSPCLSGGRPHRRRAGLVPRPVYSLRNSLGSLCGFPGSLSRVTRIWWLAQSSSITGEALL